MSELTESAWVSQTNATVEHRKRMNSLTWALWFLLLMGVSALLALLMAVASPKPAFIGWLVFAAGLAAILYRPRLGVYLILFLSLIGDKSLTHWFPFHLNFSSAESLLYVDHRLIFSPLEVYLAATLGAWLVRCAILRRVRFHRGELFWPALVFLFFVSFGLLWGLARGGNLNIALWEVRSIFYLPVMLVLAGNLLTERAHITTLFWLIFTAICIEGIIGVVHFFAVYQGQAPTLAAAVMEHSSSIHMNSFFIFILALWIYKGSFKARSITLLMVLPIVFTYLLIQRRSAFLALLVALVCVALILFRENRTAFWLIIPACAVIFSLYLVAFRNNPGSIGYPARAVISQIAPGLSSSRDQASDVYRVVENINISYNIRQSPLTGIGFGQMFARPIPLADISFFVWYQYIPHNSIGYIWMKTGIGGFLSMLYLIGLSIMVGIRALFRLPAGDSLRPFVLTAVLYIFMHFVFAYVDMSWDSQSMIYIGTVMGILGSVQRVTSGTAAASAEPQLSTRGMNP